MTATALTLELDMLDSSAFRIININPRVLEHIPKPHTGPLRITHGGATPTQPLHRPHFSNIASTVSRTLNGSYDLNLRL